MSLDLSLHLSFSKSRPHYKQPSTRPGLAQSRLIEEPYGIHRSVSEIVGILSQPGGGAGLNPTSFLKERLLFWVAFFLFGGGLDPPPHHRKKSQPHPRGWGGRSNQLGICLTFCETLLCIAPPKKTFKHTASDTNILLRSFMPGQQFDVFEIKHKSSFITSEPFPHPSTQQVRDFWTSKLTFWTQRSPQKSKTEKLWLDVGELIWVWFKEGCQKTA